MGMDAGHVQIYNLRGTDWRLDGADILSEVAGEQLDFSVALSSDGSSARSWRDLDTTQEMG